MSLEPPTQEAEMKKPHTTGVCIGHSLMFVNRGTKHKKTMYRPHVYEVSRWF